MKFKVSTTSRYTLFHGHKYVTMKGNYNKLCFIFYIDDRFCQIQNQRHIQSQNTTSSKIEYLIDLSDHKTT